VKDERRIDKQESGLLIVKNKSSKRPDYWGRFVTVLKTRETVAHCVKCGKRLTFRVSVGIIGKTLKIFIMDNLNVLHIRITAKTKCFALPIRHRPRCGLRLF